MLKGRKIFVTAGCSGIGFGCAKKFIEHGATITIMDYCSEERLTEVQAELGSNCFVIHGDGTNSDEIDRCVAYAIEKMGGLDGALNAVGDQRPYPIYEIENEDVDYAINMCLYSCIYSVRAESRYMVDNNIKGAIVNISSMNSVCAGNGFSAYSAAKAGVNMVTACSALDLGPHGIRINSISPGFTHTPATHGLTQIEDVFSAVTKRTPLGRFGKPEDHGEMASFLLSDNASFVTGMNILVDGGIQHTAYPDIFKIMSGDE